MSNQLQVLTAEIVTAYVSHVRTPPDALPLLLTSIYDTLACLGTPIETPAELTPPEIVEGVVVTRIPATRRGRRRKA